MFYLLLIILKNHDKKKQYLPLYIAYIFIFVDIYIYMIEQLIKVYRSERSETCTSLFVSYLSSWMQFVQLAGFFYGAKTRRKSSIAKVLYICIKKCMLYSCKEAHQLPSMESCHPLKLLFCSNIYMYTKTATQRIASETYKYFLFIFRV